VVAAAIYKVARNGEFAHAGRMMFLVR